ncbi:MAG TPA: AraC family transcriptional regulator [Agriterribacter sp.]|nr:AraC family transcriptional regulator [Agriterribacter sp.]
MNIELEQENRGRIEVFQSIPKDFDEFLIAHANPVALQGDQFKMLLQEFRGKGFSAWYNRFWMDAPVILRARGGIPVLELRIGLKNLIQGSWERVADPALPAHYFQMAFVPYISTRAIFAPKLEYQTFDIHFEASFLQEIGIDYKTLDLFLGKVYRDQPAELSKKAHPCSTLMIDAVHAILYNSFSAAGKKRLLQNNVTNILIAALEEIGKDEMGKLPLSGSDIEALHYVRDLIEKHCPEYLSNDTLVRKAKPHLNAFKLSYGFKRVFGINPYDYYLQLRFTLGKKLLREGHSVATVANELEYESATTFIREFRKRFGYTPKFFQKNWK